MSKIRCSNTMTNPQFFSWLRAYLRRLSMRWKPRHDYLYSIRQANNNLIKSKKVKWVYPCHHCKAWFQLKDYEIDHIIECGSLRNFADLASFCERLFCEIEGFIGLCKPCHRKKTNQSRKNNRSENG